MARQMLKPISDGEAICLASDLAEITDARETMESRLCRIAAHYRQRALVAEDLIDDLVMAHDLPGDHCETEQAINRARALLESISPAQG